MKPYYEDDHVTLYHGDCREVLPALPDASVDSVVTDPPYELGFMGKGWDATGIAYNVTVWRECLRVLKPGGMIAAFGGTRTFHRLACAIEDAGFEIRDSIGYGTEERPGLMAWAYGSGFPKSLNVTKALGALPACSCGVASLSGEPAPVVEVSVPPSPERMVRCEACGGVRGKIPQGLGTALKPAWEPIVVARKPLEGTVASNVLAHGTGALNVDGCRVGAGLFVPGGGGNLPSGGIMGRKNSGKPSTAGHTSGRWPANVVLGHTPDCDVIYEGRGEIRLEGPCAPGCPVAELDRQSGESSSRVGKPRGAASGDGWGMTATGAEYADSGGASQFFYTAKAASAERPKANGIAHPTVKPLDLMRWLVRLVTPPGGVVLDPFAGSGTTLEAAIVEGFRCIGIEREADYLPLIEQRIARACPPLDFTEATA